MPRIARIAALAAVLLLIVAAGVAWADNNNFPDFSPAPKPDTDFRGPGFYLNWVKILASFLLFLCWVKTTDWASTDGQDMKLDYLRWNSVLFWPFFASVVLLWIIPTFWISFPLMVLAYGVPLGWYVVYRNARVMLHQKVLTPDHLRYRFATLANKLGGHMAVEKADPHEIGPPVKIFAHGGPDEQSEGARLALARQTPGMTGAREILAEGLTARATAIMLDYTQQGAAMRTLIDGVWIPREGRSRETADPALESLKVLCGLNPQDRQARQQGKFLTEYQKAKLATSLAAQGTASGERVLIQFEEKKISFKSLDELGMRAKLQEELRAALSLEQGFILLSGMTGSGLRTTTDVALHGCDRFLREFGAVEAEETRYPPVENVALTTYKASEGQTPADVLPRFFRTEPNVAVIRDLVNGQTVRMICAEIPENRLIIGTIRAKDCAEAIYRVLALGVPPAELAKVLTLVVGQRLVRKLCESCKEGYVPPPQLLHQLGIPEGRVQAFYRPPQPSADNAKQEPCQECGAIGYFGRTAVFELLTVGDAVRKVLAGTPKLDLIRQAARKDGMSSLQEEGVLLVAKGVTSLPELMRVLKQ